MKKHLPLYLVTLLFIIAGVAFCFAPIAVKTTSGETISFFESLNYGNYGRFTAGNIVAICFIGSGLLLLIVSLILTLIKPDLLSGLKVFLLFTGALLVITGGVLVGCSYILFHEHGPKGVGIEGSGTDGNTQWGAIVSSIITMLGGIMMLPVAIVSIPKKEVKPY